MRMILAVTFFWPPSGRATETVCGSVTRLWPVSCSILCQGAARLRCGAFLFALLHEVFAVHEAGEGDVGFEFDVQALAELAGAEAGEEQRAFAEGFAGQSAPVDAGAAQFAEGFDDQGFVAEVGGLCGAFFAGGSAADHHEFVIEIRP
jgi:hypothetical protein